MKAVIVSATSVDLVQRPVPTVSAGEVLIKSVVAVSNPKDWKYVPVFGGPVVVQGNDVAGYVEAVGEGVAAFAKGDKVAAYTRIDGGDRAGTYAEFCISPAHTVFKIGPNTRFEEAATLPLAYTTAVLGLLTNAGLNLDDDVNNANLAKLINPTDEKVSLLVYGASSTVGVFVSQLAKKLGLFVVGVAGASGEAAKAYGADVVLDYRSPTFKADLQAVVKEHDVHSAFDAVSEGGSFALIGAALGANGGGTLTTVLPEAKEHKFPANVTHNFTWVGDAHTEEQLKPVVTKYFKLAGEWLESGQFKGQKVTVVPGGLSGVAEGLARMKEGKLSGEKLVYKIADTPGLA